MPRVTCLGKETKVRQIESADEIGAGLQRRLTVFHQNGRMAEHQRAKRDAGGEEYQKQT
jgi:hypothetical protein